jgi:putative endonuclease
MSMGNARDAENTSASWQVYILECADGSLYTGIARDAQARLVQHNAGCGARYTRSRRPARLAHVEAAPDRSAALRREAAIKALSRVAKLQLVHANEAERSSPTCVTADRDRPQT